MKKAPLTPCSACMRLELGTCPKMFFTSVRMPCGSFVHRKESKNRKGIHTRIMTIKRQEEKIRRKMERSMLKDPTVIDKELL